MTALFVVLIIADVLAVAALWHVTKKARQSNKPAERPQNKQI